MILSKFVKLVWENPFQQNYFFPVSTSLQRRVWSMDSPMTLKSLLPQGNLLPHPNPGSTHPTGVLHQTKGAGRGEGRMDTGGEGQRDKDVEAQTWSITAGKIGQRKFTSIRELTVIWVQR